MIKCYIVLSIEKNDYKSKKILKNTKNISNKYLKVSRKEQK